MTFSHIYRFSLLTILAEYRLVFRSYGSRLHQKACISLVRFTITSEGLYFARTIHDYTGRLVFRSYGSLLHRKACISLVRFTITPEGFYFARTIRDYTGGLVFRSYGSRLHWRHEKLDKCAIIFPYGTFRIHENTQQ